jgi:RNA polymerase sigma-70 factor (ECF subfamily)
LLDRISQEKLLEAIQNLSPVYRTVLNLHVYEGYTHDEIASELGISAGTSKSNLSKAKVNLKKMLQKYVEAKYAS